MTTRIRQIEGVGARKDYYAVDPHRIIVQGGWNPRTDFSGEEDLMASIVENGVQVPLRVRRGQDESIILIDGERRLRAVLRAISEGHEIQSVPCIFERPGISDIEAMFLSLITNQGKPLDPAEEASAFQRLLNWGLTIKAIATRIGKSEAFVGQRLTLVDASPEVKAAIKDGEIGIVQGVNIVKESSGDLDKQREALASAPKKGVRRPKRSTLEVILEKAMKLKKDDLVTLINRLSVMTTEG
ncbi:MAG: ParB/RepB/Spo0J family partition protein [Thermodesulfobacteriota bacterium]